MQQVLEDQRVVNEYRSMADGEREMIPLELDLFKNDEVINQHIMQMMCKCFKGGAEKLAQKNLPDKQKQM